MIVPQYWSEYKLQTWVKGKSFMLKRFGWSDVSELDARKHAELRAREAEQVLHAKGSIRKYDHKVAYNGAEGIPIREEIVSRHQDVIITRNSYGALCINTPDVLFADIDVTESTPFTVYMMIFFLFFIGVVFCAVYYSSWVYFLLGLLVILVITSKIVTLLQRVYRYFNKNTDDHALARIKKISMQYPELHLRVYRTPMGYRVLVMHDIYDPRSKEAAALLKKFDSDRVYMRMCKNQNCFRARLTPKPWRIGIKRIRPQPGIWPILEMHMPKRAQWVDEYTKKSEHYAACHFMMQLGSEHITPKAEAVRVLHDQYCKVYKTELDIA